MSAYSPTLLASGYWILIARRVSALSACLLSAVGLLCGMGCMRTERREMLGRAPSGQRSVTFASANVSVNVERLVVVMPHINYRCNMHEQG